MVAGIVLVKPWKPDISLHTGIVVAKMPLTMTCDVIRTRPHPHGDGENTMYHVGESTLYLDVSFYCFAEKKPRYHTVRACLYNTEFDKTSSRWWGATVRRTHICFAKAATVTIIRIVAPLLYSKYVL